MSVDIPKTNSADELTILEVEREIGRALPADYREFLSHSDGATPSPNFFDTQGSGNSRVRKFVPAQDLLRLCNEVAGLYELDIRALPVAEDAFGNYVLLRTSETDFGNMSFWDHETDEVSLVAASFTDFLTVLKPDTDDLSPELDPGDVEVWIDPDFDWD